MIITGMSGMELVKLVAEIKKISDQAFVPYPTVSITRDEYDRMQQVNGDGYATHIKRVCRLFGVDLEVV